MKTVVGKETVELTEEDKKHLDEVAHYASKQFMTGKWRQVPDIGNRIAPNTYPHISKDGKHIGYFPDLTHIRRKAVVVTKPGRYYKRFFPDIPDQEISRLTQWAREYQLHITTSAREIVSVYMGGIQSCMSHPYAHYPAHPVASYADSNSLALAYIESIKNKITARALVDTKAMTYWRAYGEDIIKELDAAGYKKGPPGEGAMMKAFPFALKKTSHWVETSDVCEAAPILSMAYADFMRFSTTTGRAMEYFGGETLSYGRKGSVVYFGAENGMAPPYYICACCRKRLPTSFAYDQPYRYLCANCATRGLPTAALKARAIMMADERIEWRNSNTPYPEWL